MNGEWDTPTAVTWEQVTQQVHHLAAKYAAARVTLTNTTTASTAPFTLNVTTGGTTLTTGWEQPWYEVYIQKYMTRQQVKLKPQPRRRYIARSPQNHRGVVIRSADRGQLFSDASPAELVALQLLRQLVEPEMFRRYLRQGFVSVRAKSGLVYQIDRHARIKVWDLGVHVASLCVHFGEGRIPPTDEVVSKILVVESDEVDIWKRSNVAWEVDPATRPVLQALGVTKIGRSTVYINGGGNINVANVGLPRWACRVEALQQMYNALAARVA